MFCCVKNPSNQVWWGQKTKTRRPYSFDKAALTREETDVKIGGQWVSDPIKGQTRLKYDRVKGWLPALSMTLTSQFRPPRDLNWSTAQSHRAQPPIFKYRIKFWPTGDRELAKTYKIGFDQNCFKLPFVREAKTEYNTLMTRFAVWIKLSSTC